MLITKDPDPGDDVIMALDLALLARDLHALPRAGGILDQDHYHIALIKAGLYGIGKKEEYEHKKSMPKNKGRH